MSDVHKPMFVAFNNSTKKQQKGQRYRANHVEPAKAPATQKEAHISVRSQIRKSLESLAEHKKTQNLLASYPSDEIATREGELIFDGSPYNSNNDIAQPSTVSSSLESIDGDKKTNKSQKRKKSKKSKAKKSSETETWFSDLDEAAAVIQTSYISCVESELSRLLTNNETFGTFHNDEEEEGEEEATPVESPIDETSTHGIPPKEVIAKQVSKAEPKTRVEQQVEKSTVVAPRDNSSDRRARPGFWQRFFAAFGLSCCLAIESD